MDFSQLPSMVNVTVDHPLGSLLFSLPAALWYRCLFYDWMVSDNGQTAGCRQGCLDTMSLMDRLKSEDQGALVR